MIKNIIFDLSEVIISGYRGIEEVVLESQYGTFENKKLLENEEDLDSMRENETFLNFLKLVKRKINRGRIFKSCIEK